MSQLSVADYLVEKLEKQRRRVADDIIKGDMPEMLYKRQTGVIYGLQYAIDLIHHTENQLAKEEELTTDE
jgi:hypothetical protein